MNGFLVFLAALDAVMNPPEKKSKNKSGRSFAPPPKEEYAHRKSRRDISAPDGIVLYVSPEGWRLRLRHCRPLHRGRFFIRVRPHAAKTQYVRTLADGSVKIDIVAPAEDNRGNMALVRFLADECSVAISNVTILSGKTARLKLIRIEKST